MLLILPHGINPLGISITRHAHTIIPPIGTNIPPYGFISAVTVFVFTLFVIFILSTVISLVFVPSVMIISSTVDLLDFVPFLMILLSRVMVLVFIVGIGLKPRIS